ncbi:MAG: AMP-binding protein [Deltaproteobacteria bacterium]|nr:AMP-binding protein [Deltaproteobacteria bacterium]
MSTPVATLKQLLEARVKENPENLFLILEGYSLSYSEFQRQVYQVANGFLRLGVKKGERIGLFLPNCPEFLFVVFAAAEIGTVFVPINTAFTAQEAEYVLNHSESSFLITTKHFLPLIEQIRGTCPSLSRVISIEKGNEPEVLEWNEFLYGATDASPGTVVQPADLASITYTSGTTDRPKGVMLTQYAYCFAPQKRAEALGWNERDRAIVIMPLFHVNALCHMAIAMFSVGGSILLKERFSASRFWDEVREYGVTTSSLMRTVPQILLNLPQRDDDGRNPLRLAVALLPPEQHLRFEERFKLTVVPSYSLTEDILSVLGPLDKSKRRLGSCGRPIAPEVHQLRILNENGEECRLGQLGEIVKRSPTVMKGYYKNPQATMEALRGGWLYTGDAGYLDEDRLLYFVDRMKDMVKRGDENISSAEVERILNSHPFIAESAVIGVPDPIHQEEVKAYIVLKPPATPATLTPEEIWALCQKHLALFKVPRYLEYRQELPKTPSGKVQKTPLRAEGGSLKQEAFDRLARNKKNA